MRMLINNVLLLIKGIASIIFIQRKRVFISINCTALNVKCFLYWIPLFYCPTVISAALWILRKDWREGAHKSNCENYVNSARSPARFNYNWKFIQYINLCRALLGSCTAVAAAHAMLVHTQLTVYPLQWPGQPNINCDPRRPRRRETENP